MFRTTHDKVRELWNWSHKDKEKAWERFEISSEILHYQCCSQNIFNLNTRKIYVLCRKMVLLCFKFLNWQCYYFVPSDKVTIILDREGMRKAFIDDGKQFFQMLSQFLNKCVPSLFQELLPFHLNQVKGLTMHIIFTGSQSSLIYCWRLFSPVWLWCNYSSIAQ